MDDEIKIERGIPIPSNRKKTGKWIQLLFSMKVGDSFVVTFATSNSIRTRITDLKRKTSLRFTSAAFDNGSKVRFWRVA